MGARRDAPPIVLSHVGPVLGRTVQLLVTADFLTNVLATAFRVLAGYLLALLVGLPLGLALRVVPELRFAPGPLFAGLAPISFVISRRSRSCGSASLAARRSRLRLRLPGSRWSTA